MANTALEVLTTILQDQGVTKKPKTVVEALGMLGDQVGPEGMGEHIADWIEAHPDAVGVVSDNAVTSAKIADGSVATADIANGAVTDAKLASDGVLDRVRRLFDYNVAEESYGYSDVCDIIADVPERPIEVAVRRKSASSPDVSNVRLAICSENLLPCPAEEIVAVGTTVVDDGHGSFEVTSDPSVVNGTTVINVTTAASRFELPSGTYTVSVTNGSYNLQNGVYVAVSDVYPGGAISDWALEEYAKTFDHDGDAYLCIRVQFQKEVYDFASGQTLHIMLSHSDSAYEFVEPSREVVTVPLGDEVLSGASTLTIDRHGNASLRKGDGTIVRLPQTVTLPAVPTPFSCVYALDGCEVSARIQTRLPHTVDLMRNSVSSISSELDIFKALHFLSADSAASSVLDSSGYPYDECLDPLSMESYIYETNLAVAWTDANSLHVARPSLSYSLSDGAATVTAKEGNSTLSGVMLEGETWHEDTGRQYAILLATSQAVADALDLLTFDYETCFEPYDYYTDYFGTLTDHYLVWFDSDYSHLLAAHPYVSAETSSGTLSICATAGSSELSGEVGSGTSWVVS